MEWENVDEQTDNGEPYSFTVKSGGLWAYVRKDGCADIYRPHTTGSRDRLHLCSAAELDAMIERLTKLRALALEKFGEDWREE